jgi:hypothetical protein
MSEEGKRSYSPKSFSANRSNVRDIFQAYK